MVFQFKPTTDLTGKIVLVTGGSAGVGKAACFEFARLNCTLIIASRNKEKTQAVIDQIIQQTGNEKVEFIPLVLDDLSSVKRAAELFLEKYQQLDILVNNAGSSMIPGLTKDGFEYSFGVNYLGPFLFTELLLPTLQNTPGCRVVNVSSLMHTQGRVVWEDDTIRKPDTSFLRIGAYAHSKLANVLHARKLSQLLKNGSAYSLHPGAVATDIYNPLPSFLTAIGKLFFLTEEQGAMTTLYCALEEGLEDKSGLYFDDCKVAKHNELVNDQEVVDNLYRISRELVSQYLQ
ncbi:hypothetical protein HK103_005723 [Boothiomyces macroporosus]|uniref:Short-chain dehydrogenase n=1 Tax=Boothiomyces macroporosus TaxID=261099 RepID=A0AAD5UHY8_9FUNG|nr:hypothetical protein HK103_005723 [Boothiomyces macroporosus]